MCVRVYGVCIVAFITAENFCSLRSYRVAYTTIRRRPLSIANFIRIRVCPFRIRRIHRADRYIVPHQRPVPLLSCFVSGTVDDEETYE